MRNKLKDINNIQKLFLTVVLFFSGSILVSANNPNIIATVKMTLIEFTVLPEKREPAIGNWATIATFQLRDCADSSVLFEYNGINTTASGTGTIPIPTQDVIPKDNYIIAIKGHSHLTKEFTCRFFADNIAEILDLSAEGELIAGDTSNVTDDFINSLDLSTLVGNLYTGSYKNDLNQDTFVNSLDLSNQVFNLYLAGDAVSN